jgi:hypothetical protein
MIAFHFSRNIIEKMFIYNKANLNNFIRVLWYIVYNSRYISTFNVHHFYINMNIILIFNANRAKKISFSSHIGGEERVIGRQNIVSFQKCLPRLSGQGSDLNSACQKMAI